MRWAPSRDDIEDVVAEIQHAPSLVAMRLLRLEHQAEVMADRVQALMFNTPTDDCGF